MKEVWLILKKWVWRIDFERFWRKRYCASQNGLKRNAFSSTGKMKLIKLLNLFQPIEFSFFQSLIGWIQAIKLPKNENSIGWKRFGSFISLHLAYWTKSVCFCSFYEAKHLKKRSKSTRQTHFFKNESNFFYMISDFFNKFLKTWSWTSW